MNGENSIDEERWCVTEVRERVEHQREVVARLEEVHGDTRTAMALLKTLEETLDLHEQHLASLESAQPSPA